MSSLYPVYFYFDRPSAIKENLIRYRVTGENTIESDEIVSIKLTKGDKLTRADMMVTRNCRARMGKYHMILSIFCKIVPVFDLVSDEIVDMYLRKEKFNGNEWNLLCDSLRAFRKVSIEIPRTLRANEALVDHFEDGKIRKFVKIPRH